MGIDAAGSWSFSTHPAVLDGSSFQAICQTADGGFLIGGDAPIHHDSDHGTDAYVIRTDARGSMLWQYSYGK